MHRRQLFFGPAGGYTFSRITVPSEPVPDPLVARCLEVAQRWLPGANAALVNYYTDGGDYISAHSDDEPVHAGAAVLTFSFGTTRTFRIRDKKTRTQLLDLELPSHSVAVMGGPAFQAELTHEVPVQKRRGGWRLSVTVRLFAGSARAPPAPGAASPPPTGW